MTVAVVGVGLTLAATSACEECRLEMPGASNVVAPVEWIVTLARGRISGSGYRHFEVQVEGVPYMEEPTMGGCVP